MTSKRRAAGIDLEALDKRWHVRMTTIGRRTGKPRRVTVWFACEGGKIYLAGGRKVPDWSKNIRKSADVELEIGGVHFKGKGRVLVGAKQTTHVRELMFRKYFIARLSGLFGGYKHAVPVEITPTD